MWFNKNEEKAFKPFYDFIYENEDKQFRFKYQNGVEIIVALHLYEFESDNGLESKDSNYEEYWEMAFAIIKIIHDDANKLKTGDKILVNYHTIPELFEIAD